MDSKTQIIEQYQKALYKVLLFDFRLTYTNRLPINNLEDHFLFFLQSGNFAPRNLSNRVQWFDLLYKTC